MRLHRLRAPDSGELADEAEGRRVDAEHVERARLLAVAIEGPEVQADLIDGACRDREVVALAPDRSVVELDGTTKGLRHAADHLAANDRAADAAEEGLRCDDRVRRLTVFVILVEEAADDAGPED